MSEKKKKMVEKADLTQGGLFPANWSCIGAGWKKNVNRKKAVGAKGRAPGKDKKWCHPDWFIKYCATRARARKHPNYYLFVERAKKAN